MRTQEVLGSFVTLTEPRMLIKKLADIASSEITPRNVYLNRRSFLVGAAAAGAAAVAGLSLYNRLSSPVITQASA